MCFVIAGLIVKETKGKNDMIRERKYLVCSIVYMIFGIYIFMLIALIDSPIGPPILGPSNMNFDWQGLEVIFLMFVPELVLIFSGIELLVKKSRRWLVVGSLMLILSIGLLQYWFGSLSMVYEYII